MALIRKYLNQRTFSRRMFAKNGYVELFSPVNSGI